MGVHFRIYDRDDGAFSSSSEILGQVAVSLSTVLRSEPVVGAVTAFALATLPGQTHKFHLGAARLFVRIRWEKAKATVHNHPTFDVALPPSPGRRRPHPVTAEQSGATTEAAAVHHVP